MSEIVTSLKKENKKIKLKAITKPSFWSKEEDNILMEKAKEYNFKNWNAIAKFIPGRTSIQCSARYRRIRPGLIKGAWDKEEDSKLLALYKKYGKNWAAISKEMPQRTGKQIRDRFLNSLDSKFERGKFTEEEDQMILKYYKIYGNSWARIAKKLKTRTGDMVKNRFYSSLKKYVTKNRNFLKRKRENSSTNKKKPKIQEDKDMETQNSKYHSENQKESTKEENDIYKKKEEEEEEEEEEEKGEGEIISNFGENFKETNNGNEFKIQEKNELNLIDNNMNNLMKDFEEKNNNNIIIKSDSIEDSLDYSENMNKMLDDNYDNENGIKNNVNNYACLNLEENLKKKEINNESEFNDNDYNNNNLDLFAFIGNNINNNNFYSLYNRDEIDERFDKYKKCPKLELDYKQNLREQLGIIFNLENIINQKLTSVQRQLEQN